MRRIVCLAALILAPFMSQASEKTDNYVLHVDRKDKIVLVLNDEGKIVREMACGIGKGGLKVKRNMRDMVTPTGDFKIDIILSKDTKYDAVSDILKSRYASGKYKAYLDGEKGLAKLFDNMNSIDFDGNGKPDDAYGTAYIGLDSNDAVTGPKITQYKGVPYWYSIAIHGTNEPSNIGKANSGGCIHLYEEDLKWLLDNSIVSIGSSVVIRDSEPTQKK